MTETIIGRVKEAKLYSIICDEASDASNRHISAHVNGLSALTFNKISKAFYTHCANHRLNLVIGTSCKMAPVRNLMDVIKDSSCFFFYFSPFKTEHLQNFLKKYEQGRTNCNLIDMCRT